MRIKQIISGVILGGLASWGTTFAMDIEVGRATISLNSDKWVPVIESNQSGNYSGRESGSFDIKEKSWILQDESNKVKAVLKIRSTPGGAGVALRFTAGCKTAENANVYVKDATGGSLSAIDCLRAFYVVNAPEFVSRAFKDEFAHIQTKKLTNPKAGIFISNVVTMSSGTFLSIVMLVDNDMTGLPIADAEVVPPMIKPEVIAWANEMAKASRSSVRSFSGKMVMPAIEFKQ
jgi:Tfp pilus tip-associated adhesin PilY1